MIAAHPTRPQTARYETGSESAAEQDFCAAAAALGQARQRLNRVRSAFGAILIRPLHIPAPGDLDRNAAEVAAPFEEGIPFLDDLTQMRLAVESRRTRN